MNIQVSGISFEVRAHPVFSFYAVSRGGRVFTRPAIRPPGHPRSGPKPRADYWEEVTQFIVKPKHTPAYYKCRVTQDGKSKLVSVHRFMLECWVGIRSRKEVVRHLDGNSLHNELSNLKYGTVKENVEDAFRHGGSYAAGTKNCKAKLSEDDVRSIRHRYDGGEPVRSLAKDWPQVCKETISSIGRRTTWTHIE